MADNFPNTAVWVSDIEMLEDGDLATAGAAPGDPNANMNRIQRDLVKNCNYLKVQVEALGLSASHGDSTFNGSDGRSITHNFGHQNYTASVMPTTNPAGQLGEVWITRADNTITVHNSGPFRGAFRVSLIVTTVLS